MSLQEHKMNMLIVMVVLWSEYSVDDMKRHMRSPVDLDPPRAVGVLPLLPPPVSTGGEERRDIIALAQK